MTFDWFFETEFGETPGKILDAMFVTDGEEGAFFHGERVQHGRWLLRKCS